MDKDLIVPYFSLHKLHKINQVQTTHVDLIPNCLSPKTTLEVTTATWLDVFY